MLHSQPNWNSSIVHLAEQYRILADWIEAYSTIPWHVDINWSKDALIIHLHEETFFRIFQGQQAIQHSDLQGITWKIQHLGLSFICFVPHLCTEEQSSPVPTINKESA